MKTLIYLLTVITIATSCNGPQKTEEIKKIDIIKTVNKDSLINALYQYSEAYFKYDSLDNIFALKGKPKHISTISLGEENQIADSLLTVYYDFFEFSFWKRSNTKPELASVEFFDKKALLPGELRVGQTTRQDIVNNLGLPDSDHNDPGRSMTKSGDTTVYGTLSGAGDTVTFIYYINIDEYAIGLAMTKDTLRKISWSKNPY